MRHENFKISSRLRKQILTTTVTKDTKKISMSATQNIINYTIPFMELLITKDSPSTIEVEFHGSIPVPYGCSPCNTSSPRISISSNYSNAKSKIKISKKIFRYYPDLVLKLVVTTGSMFNGTGFNHGEELEAIYLGHFKDGRIKVFVDKAQQDLVKLEEDLFIFDGRAFTGSTHRYERETTKVSLK